MSSKQEVKAMAMIKPLLCSAGASIISLIISVILFNDFLGSFLRVDYILKYYLIIFHIILFFSNSIIILPGYYSNKILIASFFIGFIDSFLALLAASILESGGLLKFIDINRRLGIGVSIESMIVVVPILGGWLLSAISYLISVAMTRRNRRAGLDPPA